MTVEITPFARRVYAATKLIPKGNVTTYKNIAIAVGAPNASRAVGTALSKNPYAPIVPCHRVITSSFKIGGFMGSKDSTIKIDLLRKEGILIDGDVLSKSGTYRQSVIYNFKDAVITPEELSDEMLKS